MLALLLLYISEIVSQEIPTQASQLRPQHFNYHAYQTGLQQDVGPTKKGPVLFPNDAPPPPRPPLVVTSRPILESIARSELNPLPQNNSTPESKPSQSSGNLDAFGNVAFDPNLGVSSNPGQNFVDVDFVGLNPESQASSYNVVPYSDILSSRLNKYTQNNGYDFEQVPTLPPIYKAISDNARRDLVNMKRKPVRYNVLNDYDVYDENRNSDENNHYAFSYRVNDHKTGDDFSHSQQSSGSATNGEYRVRLPDGRTQIVSYTADENGYNAKVTYEYGNKDQNDDKQNYYSVNNNQREFTTNDYYNYKPKENNENLHIPVQDYSVNDYNDFSSEYQNYEPYQSKFSIYNPIFSTLKPITENEISDSIKYETSTEAVLIGNRNLHTTVRPTFASLDAASPSLAVPTSLLSPSSYLASTIESLKNRITAKPVLSKNYIDRINKYITFT